MNLLFITYQGDIAGSTNSIIYLTCGLAERGHNVYVGCREESLLYRLLRDTNVHLVPMTFKSKFDLANMKKIRDTVARYNIQVINAQSSKDRYTSIFARWIFRLPVKLVHTRRQVAQSVGGLQSLLYYWGTDKMVAVSRGVKDSLVKKGIPSRHIKVIYNGTPREKYDHLDNSITGALRKKFNITQGDFIIGCVSRVKNQAQLLEALKYIDFKVKLIFVGIDKLPCHDAIVSQYSVGHEIYYEGMVPGERMLNYYPLFDVKILPSTMEGLSQSLLEAMFLKVPVLATKAAGNVDLIRHGHNGLLFEHDNPLCLKNKIEVIYHGGVDLGSMVENAYWAASSDFSIAKTIRSYEAFFQNLLDSRLISAQIKPVFSD